MRLRIPDRLRFVLAYFAFWTLLFAGTRLVFLAWEHALAARLGATAIGLVALHGLRMDLSAAAYATVIPGILVALSSALPGRRVSRLLSVYTIALIIVVALLTSADLGIFDAWGVRLDATPFAFLRTPREAIGSAESSPILSLTLITIAVIVVAIAAYRRFVVPLFGDVPRERLATSAGAVIATALLVIPLRGGLQWTPLNQSSVYFSNDEFANQATLNVPWNLVHSLTTSDALAHTNPYTGIAADDARHIVDSLLATADARTVPLLRIRRPNVIVIIWESLTAKVVARLGGVPNVTPHLDSLTHEGVFFDHFYASGDRSAQDLVAIMSGFPVLPHVQIMNTPTRSARLPQLSRDLHDAGYSTAFYYGGELAFANIKSYLLQGAFDDIVGESAFPRSEWNSKWGAHDQYVLGRMLHDIAAQRRPFFDGLFTLSSHEPFEIPMAHRFPGHDVTSEFLSSHAYADQSVGAFIRAAQREPWWDSTLVVIVADHGHPLPRISLPGATDADATHRIPMVWLGGALTTRDTVVDRYGDQTDIAPTLLAQLGLPHDRYRFGLNLLAPNAASFASYSFQDGFGFADPRGSLVYDAIGRRITERTGTVGQAEQRAGLALLRLSYQAYIDK